MEMGRIKLCQGIQVHILERDKIRPVKVGLQIIQKALELYPECFQWRNSFDLLAGNESIRKKLSTEIDVEEIVHSWSKDLSDFNEKRMQYLNY